MASSSTAPDASPSTEQTKIFDGAPQSLDIITLWNQASANNDKFQELINKVQAHGTIYFDALDTSTTTAEDGLAISIEIVDLCPLLLKKDANPEDLKKTLSDLREKAQRAHKGSKGTLDKFKDIKENLNKITASLPKDSTTEETSNKVESLAENPPLARDVEYEKALTESKSLVETLAKLSDTLDKFCAWWDIIEVRLATAKDKSLALEREAGGVIPVKVKQMQMTWEAIRVDYQVYKDKITSSSSTALDSLAVIPPCKGLNEIYTGASKSLDIINLWKQASTDNTKFQKVIKGVQDHSVMYFDALDTSITTATDGLVLSIEIIDLCPFLLKKDIDPEDIKESLSDIRDKAKKAHGDSERTLKGFRDVRKNLNEITKSLPTEPTDKETSKAVKFFSKLWPFGQDVKYEEAIAELRSLVDTLASLSENLDNFCEWWVIIEGRLTQAEKKAINLKASNRVNSVKVEQMKTTWGQIRDDYQQYRNQIMKLQDRYPSRIEAAEEE